MERVTKDQIIAEICRTAAANGGVALGWRRLEETTGIRYYDWYGQYWTRWSDAVREAGIQPNRMTEAYDEAFLLEKLALLTRHLGHVPTQGDLLLAAKGDSAFPSEKVYRRLGPKHRLATRMVAFCEGSPGFEDVALLWRQVKPRQEIVEHPGHADVPVGFVYLMKAGRFYKIGKTNAFGRRERELAIQLPEKPATVHVIKTDDPAGIEAYWHARFGSKRKDGEWFDLSVDDVRAFKRRKYM